MSTTLLFPNWAFYLVEPMLEKAKIAFEKTVKERQAAYVLELNDKPLPKELEKQFVYLRLPYDKKVTELSLLQQVRFIGAKLEAHTRFVQLDEAGAPKAKPNSRFKKQFGGMIKSAALQKVGLPFDQKLNQEEEAKLLPAMLAGAMYLNEPHLIDIMTRRVVSKGFMEDDVMQEAASRFAKVMLCHSRYREWLESFDDGDEAAA
jgi:hypothetical protein